MKKTKSLQDWCKENYREELLKEWNYEKNKDISPKDIPYNSHKIVWWICEKKHEWKATIINRTNGQNCPYSIK